MKGYRSKFYSRMDFNKFRQVPIIELFKFILKDSLKEPHSFCDLTKSSMQDTSIFYVNNNNNKCLEHLTYILLPV